MTRRTAAAPTIRRARSEEWEAVRDLRLRSLRSDPLAFGSTFAVEKTFDEARWRERATREATSSTSSQWVAEDPSGRLVGSAVIAEVEGRVNVFAMWVEPQLRGQGIGGRLLDAALDWTDQVFPERAVYLEVNPIQTAAVRLYESRGFRATGSLRPLGHTAGQSVIKMVRSHRR